MLTTVYSNAPAYIQVSSPSMPSIPPNPMAGQMRWNPNNNCIEVSNGSSWQQVGGVASISVTAEFTQIMEWARTEMHRSMKIQRMAAESPTVADAFAAYELAAEKLAVVMTLADKELA